METRLSLSEKQNNIDFPTSDLLLRKAECQKNRFGRFCNKCKKLIFDRIRNERGKTKVGEMSKKVKEIDY